jgi:hypothetical protein
MTTSEPRFIADGCRACHSADAPPEMHQQAPAAVNFDNLPEIRRWSLQIRLTAGQGRSMPPAGGPSAEERQMLVECSAAVRHDGLTVIAGICHPREPSRFGPKRRQHLATSYVDTGSLHRSNSLPIS